MRATVDTAVGLGRLGIGCALALSVLSIVGAGRTLGPTAPGAPPSVAPVLARADLSLGTGPGSRSPVLLATPWIDAPGLEGDGSARPETNVLVVAVDADPSVTDPGIPIRLNANVGGGVPPYDVTWSSSAGGFGVGSSWSFASSDAGNYSVTVSVLDAGGALAYETRVLRVNPPPAAELAAPWAALDVGTPLTVEVRVADGVAPYVATLDVNPGGPTVPLAFPASGSYSTIIAVDRAGPSWGDLTLTDSVGDVVTVTAAFGTVYPLPTVSVVPANDRGEEGAPFHLTATVTGGAPPIRWTAFASVPIANASGWNGTFPDSGTVGWVGEFGQPGNATLFFEVDDAAGNSDRTSLAIGVAAPLTSSLTVLTTLPVVGGDLALNASVRGGVPPYEYLWALSDGEGSAGNRSGPGAWTWAAVPISNGSVTVELTVTDGLDRSVTVATTVLVASVSATDPRAPPGNVSVSIDTGGWITGGAVGLSVVGALVGAWVLRWRRRTRTPGDTGEASRELGEIRELLQGSDGLERETLVMLAEEAGLSRGSTDQAVDRWIRAGRIEVRPDPAGGERLHWTEAERGSTEPAEDL